MIMLGCIACLSFYDAERDLFAIATFLVKPPLATARAASCIGSVDLFVCLFVSLSVCRQIAKKKRFSKQFNIDDL